MARFSVFLLLVFGGELLFAEGNTLSTNRLEGFYDEFLCEEKDITSEVGVTAPCTEAKPPVFDSCGAVLSRPTVPPLAMQASSTALVPLVLVNNTGLPDTDVYFLMYGREVTGCTASGPTVGSFSFVSFGPQPGPFTTTGTTGGAAEATGANTPPSATYSYALSDIPLTNGQRIIYVPYLDSGIILFSIQSGLDLAVNANSIAIPIASDPGDTNYLTVYGGMELTFFPPNCPQGNPLNQLTVDFTCVDYYGLSIYFNLFTQNPAPGLPQNRPSGIYQSREHTLCELKNTLMTASSAAASQWNDLVLTGGGKTLRVLSPGYSMSHTGGTFDPNYFDNSAAYGFSWAQDVWTGSNPYYATTPLTIVTNDGTRYNGHIMSGNFVFNASTTEQFSIPWSNVPVAPLNFTTSTAIFNVANYFPGMTYSLNGSAPCVVGAGGCDVPADAQTRATEITQYLSASIAAGLIPGKVNKLVPAGFPPSVMNSYYRQNPNLNPPGSTTGPWFDLYSLGILGNASVTGNAVYTYAYDDYLYSQASVSAQVAPSQAVIDNTTYITIFLGPYSDN